MRFFDAKNYLCWVKKHIKQNVFFIWWPSSVFAKNGKIASFLEIYKRLMR